MKIGIAWLFVLFSMMQAHAAWAPIYDVEISPLHPSIDEDISLQVSGEIGSPSWYVGSTQVGMTTDSIVLDIFFKEGGSGFPVVIPWDHTENIGMLDVGSYALTVKTYQNGQFADSLQTNFAVVPEPSSVGLLMVGGFVVYFRKRQFERSRGMPVVREMPH